MDANFSENAFRKYLDSKGFEYEENYVVGTEKNPKDVDFFIKTKGLEIYADVKEVRSSTKKKLHNNAYLHIREDISDLRKKFKSNRASLPVLLITMNLSDNYFTGFSVAQALLGDTGVLIDPHSSMITKPLHHLYKGNASLTSNKNRTISGVLVFDLCGGRHHLFHNPYAEHPISTGHFPCVRDCWFSQTMELACPIKRKSFQVFKFVGIGRFRLTNSPVFS